MAGWIAGIAVGAFVVVMYRCGFNSGRTAGKKDSVQNTVKSGKDAVRSFFNQQGR